MEIKNKIIYLHSVEWDTKSEELRWMMDRMGLYYHEIPSFVRTLQDFESFPILIKDQEIYSQVAKACVCIYSVYSPLTRRETVWQELIHLE